MIQEAFAYVEQTPDLETKLKLIDTLRTVTAGKVKLTLIMVVQQTPHQRGLKVDELVFRCVSFQFKITD